MDRGKMKPRQHAHLWMVVILFGLTITTAAFAGEAPALMTENDKASYATGVDIVRTLIRQGGQLNVDLVIQGIMDGLTGEKLLVSEKELQKTLIALQTERKQRLACQDIEFADNHKEFCSGNSSNASESSPARAPERINDYERMSSALFAASPAPPRGDGQKTPALALSQSPVPGPPASALGEQNAPSPAVMLAAQAPAHTGAPVIFERSALTQRYGDYWAKTHPH